MTYSSGHASQSCLKRRLLADVTHPRKNEDCDNPSKKFPPAGHLHLTKGHWYQKKKTQGQFFFKAAFGWTN